MYIPTFRNIGMDSVLLRSYNNHITGGELEIKVKKENGKSRYDVKNSILRPRWKSRSKILQWESHYQGFVIKETIYRLSCQSEMRPSQKCWFLLNDELKKIIILECINCERNRNKDEIMDFLLLLKLNYITVYSFIHFSIVLTFPAMTEAEIMRRSL